MEMCITVQGDEMCAGQEVLIVALVIECGFWILVSLGVWTMIKKWLRKKSYQDRLRNYEWVPHKPRR